MSLINHYCITGKNYSFLHDLNIQIIISGAKFKDMSKFPDDWLKDSLGKNISHKNKNFGTLSSHFWLWNNEFNKLKDDDWIGINHYRRFWITEKTNNVNTNNLKDNIQRSIPVGDFDVLLPEKIYLKNLKFSKLIKKGFRNYIKSPKILFNRKKISINLHFDLFHGYNLLNKSANLLESDDCVDFTYYINNSYSFHPLQIFISQKKNIQKLYEKLFKWIFECEKYFSNIDLSGYGKERLYDFLAERYFSYYFEKNLKIKTWPYTLLKENLNEI